VFEVQRGKTPKPTPADAAKRAPPAVAAAPAVRVFRRVDTVSLGAAFTAETAARLREQVAATRAKVRGEAAEIGPRGKRATPQDAQEERRRVLAEHQRLLAQAARYRIVSRLREAHAAAAAAAAEADKAAAPEAGDGAAPLRVYDVVRDSLDPTATPPDAFGRGPPQVRAAATKKPPPPPPGTLLVNNQPMVREQVAPPPADDYVYDVYVLSPEAAAEVGSASLGRAAAVVRLESFDEDLLLDDDDDVDRAARYGLAEYDTDEDSNDEDYYANDYPDEPDADADDGLDDLGGLGAGLTYGEGEEEEEAEEDAYGIGLGDDEDDDPDAAAARYYARVGRVLGDRDDEGAGARWRGPAFRTFREQAMDEDSDGDRDVDLDDDDADGGIARRVGGGLHRFRLTAGGDAGSGARRARGLRAASGELEFHEGDSDADDLLNEYGYLDDAGASAYLASLSRVVVDSASDADDA